MEQIKKKKRNKVIRLIFGILLLTVIGAGIFLYKTAFQPFSLSETVYIHINKEKDYEEVVRQLKEKANLPSEKIFRMLAERMNYPNKVKTGRYSIEDGITMPDVIRRLRSGNQAPVNLTFNNIRTGENLAGRLSQQLMVDSLSLLQAIDNPATIGYSSAYVASSSTMEARVETCIGVRPILRAFSIRSPFQKKSYSFFMRFSRLSMFVSQ